MQIVPGQNNDLFANTKKDDAPEKRVYSVTTLTRNIRVILEETFGSVWVEGEVSNFIKHQSGHMYFSIKDAGSVLSCTLFKGVNSNLKFEIKNGMQVLCFGKISVYDKRGQYQLNVRKIEPKGAGALQLAFEQLKEKLGKEGLFDEKRKRPIPFLPQKVGVVTSPTGAAIRDILNVAKRRFSNIEIIVSPAKVQGTGAKEEIVAAIDLLNNFKDIDVIIAGRGGGSLEDLWPFNEKVVARAIHRSRIPVISAVGHEVDWTISDFVSDKRAPTPSAAAELVIPNKDDLLSLVRGLSDRMKASLSAKAEFLTEKLTALKNRYVMREPFNFLIQREQEVDELAKDLISKTEVFVKFKEESMRTLAGKLDVLSPLGILDRGYSITSAGKDKKIIRKAADVKKNDIINTKLAKGGIKSRVEEVWEK